MSCGRKEPPQMELPFPAGGAMGRAALGNAAPGRLLAGCSPPNNPASWPALDRLAFTFSAPFG
jgi:hypothetical protein